jgi:hypothetical protein
MCLVERLLFFTLYLKLLPYGTSIGSNQGIMSSLLSFIGLFVAGLHEPSAGTVEDDRDNSMEEQTFLCTLFTVSF